MRLILSDTLLNSQGNIRWQMIRITEEIQRAHNIEAKRYVLYIGTAWDKTKDFKEN